jgi:hypothetical protein
MRTVCPKKRQPCPFWDFIKCTGDAGTCCIGFGNPLTTPRQAYSRAQEFEADRHSVIHCVRAGYPHPRQSQYS